MSFNVTRAKLSEFTDTKSFEQMCCSLLVSDYPRIIPHTVPLGVNGIGMWHNKAMFLAELDRRVVFVCESPGPSGNKMPPGIVLPCFNGSARGRRFHEIRKCYGLQNCYITNSVKCGTKSHELGKHTDNEIEACIGFLIDELELIQPMVAVGVGENAMHTLKIVVAPKMAKSNRVPPVLFKITHYSMRGDPAERWRCEFEELKQLLARLKPRAEW